MAFSLICPLTSSFKLSESWQFSGFSIEISYTQRAFSHKITPVLKNFLMHLKMSIDFGCFFYFNQGSHSCPGASCYSIIESLLACFKCILDINVISHRRTLLNFLFDTSLKGGDRLGDVTFGTNQ